MENNLNLPPFYIGQKVVYVTGRNMPKDSVHIVLDVKKGNCKCSDYEIKISVDSVEVYVSAKTTHIQCYDCHTVVSIGDHNSGYWAASSFRPLQEQSYPLIKYSKVLEEESVCSN